MKTETDYSPDPILGMAAEAGFVLSAVNGVVLAIDLTGSGRLRRDLDSNIPTAKYSPRCIALYVVRNPPCVGASH
eukprot:scaffold4279_cov326-Prasinococcus_capsulatus_cf.AAC.2